MTLVIILSLLSLLVVLLSIDIALSGAFRVVSAGWMIMSFIGGQVVGFSQWMALFSWSADYHPLARSTIGIILVFSLVPAITLALAIGALASDRRHRQSKVGIRALSLLTVIGTVMIATDPDFDDGSVGFFFFVIPFAVAHIGASLRFSAYPARRRRRRASTRERERRAGFPD